MPEKSEEQVLQEAARAAKSLLDRAFAERDSLTEQLQAINRRIAQLHAVANVAVAVPPGGIQIIPTMSSTFVTTSGGTIEVEPENKPQSVYTRISAIIHVNPTQEFSPSELAEIYEKEFGEKVPQSTLYAAIGKGKAKGTFLDRNGKLRSWQALKK